ncbi:DUF2529 family protein [Planococcus donghaensis]|uniref:DUF2529 domain-containing protein n=1 Tax=Planococcus donghaensis TaxID=414778 RepID=A0A1C7EG92_9BACL|nr:DUF2529 family protein [Planococcus donghaensis]ANU22397.1 hypothetical protein BCM40_03105 [Planococcus donghaensis]
MDLSTIQLTRVFEPLSEEHEAIDSIASVLAQAAVAEGTIFIAAFGEMKAVTAVALYSDAPLVAAAEWSPASIVTGIDRVFILTPHSEGTELAGRLSDAGISFALVAPPSTDSELAEAFLALPNEKTPLLQDDNRLALVPHAFAGLYIYYAVKLRIDKLLAQ